MSLKKNPFKILLLTGLSAYAMSATLASVCPAGFYSIPKQNAVCRTCGSTCLY